MSRDLETPNSYLTAVVTNERCLVTRSAGRIGKVTSNFFAVGIGIGIENGVDGSKPIPMPIPRFNQTADSANSKLITRNSQP